MKTWIIAIVFFFATGTLAAPDCNRATAKNLAKTWLQENYEDLGRAQISQLVADTFYDDDLYNSWITYIVSNDEVSHFIKVGCDGVIKEMVVPQN